MPGFIIPFDIAEDFSTGESAKTDFREVPSTDVGNKGYRDRGRLGWYAPSEKQYTDFGDVRWFEGYGADEADLRLGFIEPTITESPAYQLQDYKDRWDLPKARDLTPGNVEAHEEDYAFKRRNRESKGFLPRPRIPRDRG